MTGVARDYAPDLARNAHVTLVRYIPTPDGWKPELVTGRYQGRTKDHWLLSTGMFPRNEWQACDE